MSWDPDIYMKFASERTRSAMELLARVPLRTPAQVIDLGCGPGNSTALLAARWPAATIEGLESSPDMLAKARASGVRASWIEGEVALDRRSPSALAAADQQCCGWRRACLPGSTQL
jgi:trans-aconitate 2-methyltransferase